MDTYKIGAILGMTVVLAALFTSVQPVLSQTNETATTASVTVNKYISVTLSNVPIQFGSVDAGSTNNPATVGNGYPMTIQIDSVTNVNTNISVNGSDFSGPGTFGVGNLSFSNSSSVSTATNMQSVFSSGPPYSNWVNIVAPAGGAAKTADAYFWVSIPSGQIAGSYSSTVYVRVEEA
jgi:hypothetical protein